MEAFITTLWVFGYIAGGVITAIIYEVFDKSSEDDKDHGSSFGIVIMWPLVIIVFVIFILIIGKSDEFVKWAGKSIKEAYKKQRAE